ncbi:MAG: peptide ABC transporter substrate-binding protein [Betaproteobacteria bacterium]|nr:peptide ABC transporter substrate-binding protein [Betaproteobacteria bacterium]
MNRIDLHESARKPLSLSQWPVRAAALALALGISGALQAASAPNRIVTVVLSEEPEGLDGCNANRSSVGRVVKQNIVETLTEIDPKDGSITPRLALSWTKVDDKTWRFKLREGVKFHDGAPFNAETAVRAIHRTMDTGLKTGARGTGGLDCETRTKSFGDLKIVAKAIDPSTLEISASKAVPILPTRMGVVSLSSPNTPTDKLVLNPIGTGPYKFDKWVPGQEITLTRFDGYWGKKPQATGVRYLWRKESAVRAAMVKVGEADIAPDIAVQDANDPSMDFSYPNSETSRLRIDMTRPPLNDKRVRLALNYAIDRAALKSVLSKDVIPATQIVVSGINGHNPTLKPYPYDLAKAKKLLAEAKAAGVPVDKELEIVGRTNLYPNGTEHMEATMAMLQAAGFKVKMRMLEVAEWIDILTKPYAEDRGPVLLQEQHDNNNGDAVFSVFNKFACKGAQSVVCDPKLDALIAKASSLSGDERRKTWQEVFRMIQQDIVSDVWMYHMVGYSRVGNRINFKPSISTNSEIHIEDVTFKK